jgi:hypothetical protein
MFFAARYVGGLLTSRSHKGDKDARPPISLVPVDKQRDALELLEDQVFSDEPFQFPAELYKYLAASNWDHWGLSRTVRKDYPAHGQISMWQARILDVLLSATTLERMHDTELKAAADEELLTTAELLQRLSKSIFSELDEVKEGEFTDREPAISSLRRNLQRDYLRRLSRLAMGETYAPDDCQTIAYSQLASIESRMRKALKGKAKLDAYSRAHLLESADRIRKVREARLLLYAP